MSLRIAGTADAEAVVDGFDVVNQLTGMIVFENRTALLRDIAAKRHDVLDAFFLINVDHIADMLAGGGYTGQVSKNRCMKFILNVCGDGSRVFGGASAGTIGDAHERRMECGNFARGLFDGGITVVCFRRKHFKRDGNLMFCKNLCNFHNVLRPHGI